MLHVLVILDSMICYAVAPCIALHADAMCRHSGQVRAPWDRMGRGAVLYHAMLRMVIPGGWVGGMAGWRVGECVGQTRSTQTRRRSMTRDATVQRGLSDSYMSWCCLCGSGAGVIECLPVSGHRGTTQLLRHGALGGKHQPHERRAALDAGAAAAVASKAALDRFGCWTARPRKRPHGGSSGRRVEAAHLCAKACSRKCFIPCAMPSAW